jgi:hypothetical protein
MNEPVHKVQILSVEKVNNLIPLLARDCSFVLSILLINFWSGEVCSFRKEEVNKLKAAERRVKY